MSGLELFSGLVGAALGGVLTLVINKDNLNDSLDSKSGWREKLFDVASKDQIGFNEVYRVRAALRLAKHKENNGNELIKYSFDWMTNYMIDYLEDLMAKNRYYRYQLNEKEKEVIRIFCRYLLKNHWEYRESMAPKNIFYRNLRNNLVQDYAKESIREIEKIESEYYVFQKKGRKLNMEKSKDTEELQDNQDEEIRVQDWISIISKFLLILSLFSLGSLLIPRVIEFEMPLRIVWGMCVCYVSIYLSFITSQNNSIVITWKNKSSKKIIWGAGVGIGIILLILVCLSVRVLHPLMVFILGVSGGTFMGLSIGL